MHRSYLIEGDFIYDFEKGVIIRVRKYIGVNGGVKLKAWSYEIAGYFDNYGYCRIMINKKVKRVHRVLYEKYHNIKIPDNKEIDHRDRNRSNNVITNLRMVSRSQNAQNSSLQTNNTSGYKGISFNKREKKWTVSITLKGKRHFLGYFVNLEEAVKKRNEMYEYLNTNRNTVFAP